MWIRYYLGDGLSFRELGSVCYPLIYWCCFVAPATLLSRQKVVHDIQYVRSRPIQHGHGAGQIHNQLLQGLLPRVTRWIHLLSQTKMRTQLTVVSPSPPQPPSWSTTCPGYCKVGVLEAHDVASVSSCTWSWLCSIIEELDQLNCLISAASPGLGDRLLWMFVVSWDSHAASELPDGGRINLTSHCACS